ncbi:lipid-binding SYLF domain-containing protein [Phaeovibrio sulfidiphilus]|uniref:Lipid-binding SYLF domain-containing protein n=1 Tax=Phaeovibrio sulfidiphilus TaxID=1220600 RepID=A0A8J7CQ72_9PROT|nr:lipid-binding SYLF domain-containing protein [Phaeovibrio sulfidiphilus]MBE1236540.1 lipid-binding SYLF domain-containing protein [Phaeovibrio sulfidiphilus]
MCPPVHPPVTGPLRAIVLVFVIVFSVAAAGWTTLAQAANGSPVDLTSPAWGDEFSQPTMVAPPPPVHSAGGSDSYGGGASYDGASGASGASGAPGAPRGAKPPLRTGTTGATSSGSQYMTAPPTDAEARRDARALILASEATLYRMMTDGGSAKSLNDLLPKARGLLIVPSFTRAGFIVGGAWGNGILMTRLRDGSWSSPAFYRLTAGSLGLQVGIQDAEIVFLLMTEAGIRAVMQDQFKGGATASATFLFVGGGAEASTTTNVGADIYGFSQSTGLYGGLNLEGTAVEPRYSWNQAIYGPGLSPAAIAVDGRAQTPLADGLKEFLAGR